MTSGETTTRAPEQTGLWILSKRQAYAAYVCGIALAATMTPTVMDFVVNDFGPKPTHREKVIGDAIKGSITDKRFNLHCVPVIKDEQGEPMKANGIAVTRYRLKQDVYLRNDICAGVMRFSRRQRKERLTEWEAKGILVASHEAEHVHNDHHQDKVEDVNYEAENSCNAFQELPGILEALGATAEQAERIQGMMVSTYSIEYRKTYQTNLCYDGGPLDMDPARPGIFPYAQDGTRVDAYQEAYGILKQ